MSSSSTAVGGGGAAVKLVVQRCKGASLVLDNAEQRASIGRGLVAYISFTSAAEAFVEEKRDGPLLEKVARAVLNLPMVTMGDWGDGTKPASLIKLSASMPDAEIGVMIIPQAGITCKLKGKYIQYRGQCKKNTGAELYSAFCEKIAAEANKKCPNVQMVFGTFGNRQGLTLEAGCGPFTHVFEF